MFTYSLLTKVLLKIVLNWTGSVFSSTVIFEKVSIYRLHDFE